MSPTHLKLPINPDEFQRLVVLADGDKTRVAKLLINYNCDLDKVEGILDPPKKRVIRIRYGSKKVGEIEL